MAGLHDWLPSNHESLINKATQTVTFLTAAIFARIGVAGAALTWYQDKFMVRYNRFKAAFENWKNPAERTPVKTTVLQEAEEEFIKVYRILHNWFMKENPLVTDDDLQSAGFPKRHSGGNRSAKRPATQVEMETDLSNPAEVTIHYREAGSHGTAKPDGVHAMEFVYVVRAAGEPPPGDWSELTYSVVDTRTPLTLTFTGEQRGMILYFSSRWENTRGEKGPWNSIRWVIIP
ncbi:MAG: hypothetical protein LBL42_00960 [Tannerella sp.]|jgi:hypothetical protein|nr:hypothetical protein [Tannerella sp.]